MKHLGLVLILLVVLSSVAVSAYESSTNDISPSLSLECFASSIVGSSIKCGYLKVLPREYIEEENYGIYRGTIPEGAVVPKREINVQILFREDSNSECSEVTGKRKAPYEISFISSEEVLLSATLKENGRRSSMGKFDASPEGITAFITEDVENAIIIASWDGGSSHINVEPSSCQDIIEGEFEDYYEELYSCDGDDCDLSCDGYCEFETLCERGEECSLSCVGDECLVQCVGLDCGQCTGDACQCLGRSCVFTTICGDGECGLEIEGNPIGEGEAGCIGDTCIEIEGSEQEGGFSVCSVGSGDCGFAREKEDIRLVIERIGQGEGRGGTITRGDGSEQGTGSGRLIIPGPIGTGGSETPSTITEGEGSGSTITGGLESSGSGTTETEQGTGSSTGSAGDVTESEGDASSSQDESQGFGHSEGSS